MPISILIIEDNPAAMQQLEEMLQTFPNLQVVGKAWNIEEGSQKIKELRPSLLFIDVELPDGSGIQLWNHWKELAEWHMDAIFYTSYDKYAIEALRSQALDYLTKPTSKEQLAEAIQRYLYSCTTRYLQNEQNPLSMPQDHMLVVNEMNHKIKLSSQSVVFFQYISNRKVWEAFCDDKKSYILHHGTNAENILDLNPDFIQVHKSHIVNINFIQRFEGQDIILQPPYQDKTNIHIGISFKTDLFSKFLQL